MKQEKTNALEETRLSKNAQLINFVGSKITRIQNSLLGNNPSQQARARALLANLRNAPISGEPVFSEAWQITLGHTGLTTINSEDSEIIPKSLISTNDEPSRYEFAAYTALVCYSHHQQSNSSPMHLRNKNFAERVGYLVSITTPSVKTRFDSLNKATNAATINIHLKNVITLLKSEEIAFDYGLLARDLAQLYSPRTRNKPLLRWSRDFVFGFTNQNNNETPKQ